MLDTAIFCLFNDAVSNAEFIWYTLKRERVHDSNEGREEFGRKLVSWCDACFLTSTARKR
jgi:hypothetical protein